MSVNTQVKTGLRYTLSWHQRHAWVQRKSCFGFLTYKTLNNYIARILFVLIFVASDHMYRNKKVLEKGRQFCDFQGEVNPNTYFLEHCLVGAAITLPNIGMHFVSDSAKQQLYFPSFVVLHYLPPPIRSLRSSVMDASLACSVLRFIYTWAWASQWQGLLGYVLIEILMQEWLRWITLK